MNTNFRSFALASVLAIGATIGAAQAQSASFSEPGPGPYIPGTTGSIVGGGYATVTGGGDAMTVTHSGNGPVQHGPVARAYGASGEVQVEYLTPAPAAANPVVRAASTNAGRG
jgi:hypothetical protein